MASIRVGASALTIRAPDVFSTGRQTDARRFARRVMALEEVRSLTIEPEHGEASLHYRVPDDERVPWLERLSAAIDSDAAGLADAAIPHWRDGQRVTLSRACGVITALRVIETRPGLLRFGGSDPLPPDQTAAQRVARALASIPGVGGVDTESIQPLAWAVRFDPSQLGNAEILRAAERELAGHGIPCGPTDTASDTYGISNATLGLGAVGELMLPVATPLAAGVLVATKLGVIHDAAVQLGRGKVGLPLFDTALLTCSIVTGQVLAYALTDWSLRFWQRRWRAQAAAETRLFLSETLTLPERSLRLGAAGEPECAIAAAELRVGDRIRLTGGEHVPADGVITDGVGLVDDSPIGGPKAATRRSTGDRLLAGSVVDAGALVFEVERTGADTQAATLAATLVDVARSLPRDRLLHEKSEQLAGRTVIPTLATAGIGWAAGDLITVGAILHQDWISGPALAVPLLTLNAIREAFGHGALVRSATALQRLAEADFIVLDGDDPALTAPTLELADIQSPLPELDAVLQHAASAGLYLGDERTNALADACRDRDLPVRRPELMQFDREQLVAQLGKHRIRLREGSRSVGAVPDLRVEIDDREVAHLRFRRSNRPRAAGALQPLGALGITRFVVSEGPDTPTRALAQQLGIDWSGGDLDADGTVRFLHGLRKRGLRPVYVGRLSRHPDLAAAAHVAINTESMNVSKDRHGDMVLLGRSYESLRALIDLARSCDPKVIGTARKATIPNLLCIAGAFAGLLNGITAGLIANVGVLSVDRELKRILQAQRPGKAA